MINHRHAILHTIDTTGPGGAETVFLDLAENLTVEGFDNFAIIKGSGWVEEQLKARGIRYYIVKPRGPLSLPYYRELYRLLRQHNVKLVQAHLLGSTLTYSLLSILMRVPLVATLHGQVDVNPAEKRVYLKNKIMRLGVNRLITVSQGLADYISERGLFSKGRIGVIYNGVNMERYGPNQLKALRNDLKLDENAILIGSVGNIRPAKAYDVLIQAAKLVCGHRDNIHFVIAGHPKRELMDKLQSQLERQNLQGHVHFIGFHDNTAEFLGQLDVFALSSSSEGFSIATIEAMATGLPVVVTRCGGPEEIVKHGETGLMVPTHDHHALADALEKLIDNPDLRSKLGAAGKNHAIRTFSMTTLLERYRNEYLKLLPQGTRSTESNQKPSSAHHSNTQQ